MPPEDAFAPPRIVVVDDEPALCAMMEDYLTLQKFRVATAAGGAALDRALQEARADLVVMDVDMPGEDGIAILRRLRAAGARLGVVMLTANGDEAVKLQALGLGADDYVVKPFALRELLARIRAVLRRLPPPPPAAPEAEPAGPSFGAFRLDLEGRRLVDPAGVAVAISVMEFELLAAFARHPRQILSRERLYALAHGRELEPGDRSVDIRMARLRKKLEAEPGAPKVLQTVRGEGYRYEPALGG